MNSLQFAAISMMVGSPLPATDVSASMSIGHPGSSGHTDVGDYPPPQLINRRPVRAERVIVERLPVYLQAPWVMSRERYANRHDGYREVRQDVYKDHQNLNDASRRNRRGDSRNDYGHDTPSIKRRDMTLKNLFFIKALSIRNF